MRPTAPRSSLLARRLSRLPAAAVLLTLPFLAGCPKWIRIGGSRSAAQETDRLRVDNQKLKDQVGDLQQKLTFRDALIKEMQIEKTPPILKGAGAEGIQVPRLVTIAIDRLSGVLYLPGSAPGKKVAVLRLYLFTRDQEGRFLPVAGQAAIQVTCLNPGQPPAVIADVKINPDQFDQAFRSGLTGTHYTLDIPLTGTAPPGTTHVTASIRFSDAGTGADISAQGVFAYSAPATQPGR